MTTTTHKPNHQQRLARTLIQINRFILDHGYAPTITELATYTGRLHTAIWKHVYRLEKMGAVTTRSADLYASVRYVRITVNTDNRRRIFERGHRVRWNLEQPKQRIYGETWL